MKNLIRIDKNAFSEGAGGGASRWAGASEIKKKECILFLSKIRKKLLKNKSCKSNLFKLSYAYNNIHEK